MTHGCVPNPDGSCSICGDVAQPATVITLNPADNTAEVSMDGATATVALDLVEGVSAGDSLLVHLGFAIARVDGAGEEAAR